MISASVSSSLDAAVRKAARQCARTSGLLYAGTMTEMRGVIVEVSVTFTTSECCSSPGPSSSEHISRPMNAWSEPPSLILDDIANDVVECRPGTDADCALQLRHVGDPTEHVLETFGVGILVGHELDRRRTLRRGPHPLGQLEDRDLFVGANVEHLTHGGWRRDETHERLDGVSHVAE